MSGTPTRERGALARQAAGPGELQRRILELWRQTRIDWSFASRGLNDELRSARGLGSGERRFAADVLFGMIRHLRRLDEALKAGGARGGASAPDALRLLAYLVLEEQVPPDEVRAGAAGADRVDWRRVASIDEALGKLRPARRIACRYSLPDWLAKELVRDHGERAEALAAALNQRAPTTVRANLLAGSAADVAAALADEGVSAVAGRYAPTALTLDSRVNVRGLKAFTRGALEAQDEGSQLVAELASGALPERPLIADVCAGAGGKTLAMAAATANRGRVLAADVDRTKLDELRRRARRAGVSNVHAIQLDADGGYPAALGRARGKADRVLVDATCSGMGALRRNPAQRWRLAPHDLQALPRLQLDIASLAVDLLAPGGLLVYATCTVLAAENRAVVERLAAAHPALAAVPIAELLGPERAAQVTDETGRFLELFPNIHGTDGFFAAAFRRTSC